jgi:signal transduction histidine kinase
MTLLTVFLNILVTYVPGAFLRLYPLWKTRDWKTRGIILFYIGNTAFQFGGALLLRQWAGENIGQYNLSVIALGIPQMIVPFFIFRKRFLQQFFLLAVSAAYHTITVDIGNFVRVNWTGNAPGGIVSVLATLAVAALTLPPLLLLLRRLYANPGIICAAPFWRLFWLLPLLFFGIIEFTSSYFIVDELKTISLVLVRVFVYAAVLLICVLMETAVRYVSEAEAAKRKSEEAAAKADFYHRMAHDLLTPLTRVSTDIQIANRKEATDHKRLTDSQADIMEMASTINSALRDYDGEDTE